MYNCCLFEVEGLTITFHGREIVTDTKLELNMGRRYGLIGLNGSGTDLEGLFKPKTVIFLNLVGVLQLKLFVYIIIPQESLSNGFSIFILLDGKSWKFS